MRKWVKNRYWSWKENLRASLRYLGECDRFLQDSVRKVLINRLWFPCSRYCMQAFSAPLGIMSLCCVHEWHTTVMLSRGTKFSCCCWGCLVSGCFFSHCFPPLHLTPELKLAAFFSYPFVFSQVQVEHFLWASSYWWFCSFTLKSHHPMCLNSLNKLT